ncbi:hypothetical protein PVAP13_9KG311871 [Panicum virgatum]|uniref:Uncharacterized protein n=1 Tax=Panicum virgatum TaxID=38727 RepID=A0A8T0NNR0_PANVG|nr:hypothetical protein PVAP13_9KG311871 [Panicum virgatum]
MRGGCASLSSCWASSMEPPASAARDWTGARNGCSTPATDEEACGRGGCMARRPLARCSLYSNRTRSVSALHRTPPPLAGALTLSHAAVPSLFPRTPPPPCHLLHHRGRRRRPALSYSTAAAALPSPSPDAAASLPSASPAAADSLPVPSQPPSPPLSPPSVAYRNPSSTVVPPLPRPARLPSPSPAESIFRLEQRQRRAVEALPPRRSGSARLWTHAPRHARLSPAPLPSYDAILAAVRVSWPARLPSL